MPSLYNEYEMLDKDQGYALCVEVADWIDPLIQKYATQGYLLREIESVIVDDIHVAFCEALLKRSMAKVKAERAAAHEKARHEMEIALEAFEALVTTEQDEIINEYAAAIAKE